ncbi:MAG TPA: FKBP-type peptidyl-prolyl cis-trans isomerase [Planctomycetes bacterium]|nr:FKBP-type peptidyl-prolyl cis-trans isomerase [Planctomycetota bacterium]
MARLATLLTMLLCVLASCVTLPTRSPVYAARILPSGVSVRELAIPNKGTEARSGDRIALHYELFLGDGTLVDSSRNRGVPIEFVLGSGTLGAGFEEGLVGLKVHGRREIVVPPEEAFGEEGVPPRIPPRAILRMVAELVSIEPRER